MAVTRRARVEQSKGQSQYKRHDTSIKGNGDNLKAKLDEKPMGKFLLSAMEKEIMELVAKGKGTCEITEALIISNDDVEHCLHSIIGKLNGNGDGKNNTVAPTQLTNSAKPKIVASIPCYNEERFIGDVIHETKQYVDQVIVIDDGSHDGSVQTAIDAGALIVNHGENRGYGEAIKSCFNMAKLSGADILVTIDGDNQHRPEEIPTILVPIIKGEADMVIGSRLMSKSQVEYQKSQKGSMPIYRKFGINVITFLCNLGSKTKISDAQSGFRAYRRDIIDKIALQENGMGVSVELLLKAVDKGFTIKEVPISCSYHAESSTQNPVRHGLGVALTAIRLRFRSLFYRLLDNHNA